jgi:O-antigen/teichoic acid export membrane protein
VIGRLRGRRRAGDGVVTPGRVAQGVLLNVVATVILAGTGFLLTAFLIHRLGPSSFGAWVLVASVLAYSSILDFGVGLTVMRFIAEVAHLPDRREANRIVSTAVVVYTGAGAVLLVAGLILTPQVADLFGIVPHERGEFITAFRISCAALALTFPSAVWTAVLQGLQDFARLNLWIVAQSLAVMATQMVVVELGYGLVALALVGAVGNMVLLLGKRWTARGHGIRTAPRLCEAATLRRIISVSSWVFLLNVSGRLILDTDAVLIGVMLGTSAVAAYQVALGPATAVRRAADQFNSVSLTAAASLKAQDELRRLQQLLIEATRAVTCVFLPCIALLAAWGDQLLSLWVGPEFTSSYATLVVLTTGVLAIAIQGTAGQVLLALNRHRLMAVIAGAEAICNLGLSIVLARRYGIVGVALGTAIPAMVTSFGITLPYACRLVGVPYASLVRRVLPPIAIAGAAYLALALGQRIVGDFPNLGTLVVASTVLLALALGASLLADRQGRRTYLPMLRALSPRRARAVHT